MNPIWWIPQGYGDYMKIANNSIPHSNITAHLLDGGMLGVVCWFGMIVIPAFQQAWILIRKHFQVDAAIVSAICIGSFVAQLSLNVPFVDQTWLWGGVSCASLTILHREYQNKKIAMLQKLHRREGVL